MPHYLVPNPRCKAPRAWPALINRLASPLNILSGRLHVFAAGGGVSVGLVGWLAAVALPIGWLAVRTLLMCVLELVANTLM